jgi:dimethylargininase
VPFLLHASGKSNQKVTGMTIAITREISAAMAHCELSYITREPIELQCCREQHAEYEKLLASCGCRLVTLTEQPDLPDSVFVEDTALVFDELAIITRPGAISRRPETATVAEALRPYRELEFMQAPATLDGGDVLSIGKQIFVGQSQRTNRHGLLQLQTLLKKYGYQVHGVEVRHCLHLKSAVTAVDDHTLLINPVWACKDSFPGFRFLEIDMAESHAANCLRLSETLIYPTAFPNTLAKLDQAGYRVKPVDLSELAKAEGAVTCCSLVFRA